MLFRLDKLLPGRWDRKNSIAISYVTLKRFFFAIVLFVCLTAYGNLKNNIYITQEILSAYSISSHFHGSIDSTEAAAQLFPAGHALFKGSFRNADLSYNVEPQTGCHKLNLADRFHNWYHGVTRAPERPITIFVTSIPNEFEERLMVRETWAKNVTRYTKIIFCLGLTLDTMVQTWIEREAIVYGDILQFNVMEDYKNLAWKTFFMLNWAAQTCPDRGLVMKTDTDTLIVIDGMYKLEEANRNATDTIWGACPRGKSTWTGGGNPIRDKNSKWYASEQVYPEKTYPNFCSGTGYVMTGDVPAKLVSAAKTRDAYFHLEDVMFTGIAAQTANVTRQWHVGFSAGGGINCRPEAVTQHLWHADKRQMEAEFLKRERTCSSSKGLGTAQITGLVGVRKMSRINRGAANLVKNKILARKVVPRKLGSRQIKKDEEVLKNQSGERSSISSARKDKGAAKPNILKTNPVINHPVKLQANERSNSLEQAVKLESLTNQRQVGRAPVNQMAKNKLRGPISHDVLPKNQEQPGSKILHIDNLNSPTDEREQSKQAYKAKTEIVNADSQKHDKIEQMLKNADESLSNDLPLDASPNENDDNRAQNPIRKFNGRSVNSKDRGRSHKHSKTSEFTETERRLEPKDLHNSKQSSKHESAAARIKRNSPDPPEG